MNSRSCWQSCVLAALCVYHVAEEELLVCEGWVTPPVAHRRLCAVWEHALGDTRAPNDVFHF